MVNQNLAQSGCLADEGMCEIEKNFDFAFNKNSYLIVTLLAQYFLYFSCYKSDMSQFIWKTEIETIIKYSVLLIVWQGFNLCTCIYTSLSPFKNSEHLSMIYTYIVILYSLL